MARTSRKVLSTVAALSAAAAALLTLSTPALGATESYTARYNGIAIQSAPYLNAPILGRTSTAPGVTYERIDGAVGDSYGKNLCPEGTETLGWWKIQFIAAGPTPGPDGPSEDVAYVPQPCLTPAY